jgi:hypothetical protein
MMNKIKRETEKILVASTNHISEKDNETIYDMEGLDTNLRENCSYIYVPSSEDMVNFEDTIKSIHKDVSEGLLQLMRIAYKEGYSYIKLVQDGPEYPDLPNYNWS